jgi:cyclase
MVLKSAFKGCVSLRRIGMVVTIFGLAFWGSAAPVAAQQDASGELDVLQLRLNFYMVAEPGGGNIAVQTGKDGTILVNAGSADSADRAIAAIRRITNQPIRYIIDTSADGDLVGGNAKFAHAGRNIMATGPEPLGGAFVKDMTFDYAASIFSAEQTLFRISAPTGQKSPYPQDAWPVETFTERRRDMYFNGEGCQIYNEPAAHSDGDAVVLFRGSDVVVAGDIIDANRFPWIDLSRGGSIQGEIEALNHIIDLSVRPMPFVFQEGGTYIVPGHGRAYTKRDAVGYRDMVVTIRDIIQDMIQRGMTLVQIKEAAPARAFELEYGANSGPWTTNDFVEAVYKSLTAKK